MLTKLNTRESTILKYRFGLDGEKERTLEEVGQEFGVLESASDSSRTWLCND